MKSIIAVLATMAAAVALPASTASAATTTATTTATATPASCDQACQAAWQQQEANALPRTSFYQAPTPLPVKPAGTLIRQQATSAYQVADQAVTATRILYHSRTSAGHDVAVSGVVLVPPGTPPSGGWPVVVDAHGTSGIARDCAPSLMRDLYHGDQMLQFIGKGWAVVAPDYAGMGTDGRVEFVNATAESNDLFDGLLAARQTGLGLSSRWVLWGHSQGGGAALAAAQRLVGRPDAGYRGAVFTSPAADLTGAISRLAQTPYVGGGFVALLAGRGAVAGPVLLLQGDADVVVTPAQTDQVSSALCAAGVTVDYRTYPGLGHDTFPGQVTGIDDGAMSDILTWVAARFAGQPAPSTCR